MYSFQYKSNGIHPVLHITDSKQWRMNESQSCARVRVTACSTPFCPAHDHHPTVTTSLCSETVHDTHSWIQTIHVNFASITYDIILHSVMLLPQRLSPNCYASTPAAMPTDIITQDTTQNVQSFANSKWRRMTKRTSAAAAHGTEWTGLKWTRASLTSHGWRELIDCWKIAIPIHL